MKQKQPVRRHHDEPSPVCLGSQSVWANRGWPTICFPHLHFNLFLRFSPFSFSSLISTRHNFGNCVKCVKQRAAAVKTCHLLFLWNTSAGRQHTTHTAHTPYTRTHTFKWFVSNISNKASATAVTASRRSSGRRRRRDEPKNERKTCLHPLTTLCILFTHCPIEHHPRPLHSAPHNSIGKWEGAQVLRTLRHFSLLSGCTCKNQENREEQKEEERTDCAARKVPWYAWKWDLVLRWPSEHNAN